MWRTCRVFSVKTTMPWSAGVRLLAILRPRITYPSVMRGTGRSNTHMITNKIGRGDQVESGKQMVILERGTGGTSGPDAAELRRRSVIGLNGLNFFVADS
jgi:hypothetical protein